MKYDYPDTLIKNPSKTTVGKAAISHYGRSWERSEIRGIPSLFLHKFEFRAVSALGGSLIFIIYEALKGFMEFFVLSWEAVIMFIEHVYFFPNRNKRKRRK